MPDRPVRRALLSVSDKTGLVAFARGLHELQIDLISTGGTRKALADAGLPVREVAEVTGFPEMLDGRVKTLHPHIHGGVLARRDLPEHMSALAEHAIQPIDLVVCNLYPFERVVKQAGATAEEIIEEEGLFPPTLHLTFHRRFTLRYGENPHQQAAFYAEPGATPPSIATAKVLHGKELSYNNLLDLDSALNLVRSFARPAAVVIKHNNPCGAAQADTLVDAFRHAYEGDPLSAFGGILGFNRELDGPTAEQITAPQRFIEAIVAPTFSPEALHLLKTRPKWKDSVRLLEAGPLTPAPPGLDYRRIGGGLLMQACDVFDVDWTNVKVVTKRVPTAEEVADMQFAWRVAKHVKSNAIVLAKGGMVVGVGAGQMSRVDSVNIAVRKAGERAKGSVLASDAFFPFRDNIDLAATAGIAAVVQPGGSVRDAESVAACDENGMAMVLTGVRHFRH